MFYEPQLRSLESGIVWAMRLKKTPKFVAEEIVRRYGASNVSIHVRGITTSALCDAFVKYNIKTDLCTDAGRKYLDKILDRLRAVKEK